MKQILVWNVLFLISAFTISTLINGYETTIQYWMCDYFGYGFILTGQRILKKKSARAFPIYIVGLIFNLIFGIMNKSIVHALFCIYSIYILIDNWNTWKKSEKAGEV